MKFGVREICEVVLRAKTAMKVGSKQFYKNEPVLYFDSLTTSSLEGNATTVYAQGGRGNARLLAWEGERTLTFNMTDALISAESFGVLSGATVLDANDVDGGMIVHTTSRVVVERQGQGGTEKVGVNVPGLAMWNHGGETNTGYYNAGADIFLMKVDGNEMSEPAIPYDNGVRQNLNENTTFVECYAFPVGSTVLVDYYVKQNKGKQIEITPDKFGGFFYLEASTLFRDEDTGKDLPAEFIIPRCKIQSNFTFTMAATGDPSTFDFVLDAFPDYTKFDPTKKVLAILQVVEDAEAEDDGGERAHISKNDLPTTGGADGELEHKTRYGTDGPAVDYADGNDMIASTDFRKGPAIILDTNVPGSALHGKTLGELQSNVAIKGNNITGTLYYVEDYDYAGTGTKADGNFLALHVDTNGFDLEAQDTTYKIGDGAAKAIPANGVMVFKVDNKAQQITIKATNTSGVTNEEVYSLAGITLAV